MTQATDFASAILDCTLRDGGYYTNWEFRPELVDRYLDIMDDAPVQVVELGFSGKGADRGYYASMGSRKCEALTQGRAVTFSVMIDAKDFMVAPDALTDRLTQALGARDAGNIEIVRVAVKYSDAARCGPLCETLSRLGYRVFLNLMQIDLAEPEELDSCLEAVGAFDGVETVYVADSFGSMLPDRVGRLVATVRSRVGTPVGFHAHDNRGLAVTNSVRAKRAGATWIDCTVAGMGRGAGNAATEQLLPVVASDYPHDLDVALQELNVQHFQPLQRHYGWGASVLYGYAAVQAIHPMYVQALHQDGSLDADAIFDCLRQLADQDATAFDGGRLDALKSRIARRVTAPVAALQGATP